MQYNWQYVGLSIFKTSENTTRVCAVFGTAGEECTTLNTVFSLAGLGGDTMSIGNSYKGMMKDFKIYDWPKTGYEWGSMIKTSG